VRTILLIALMSLLPTVTHAGAPRVKGTFVNYAGPRPDPGGFTMLSFLGRRAWESLSGGRQGAPLVPFDREAIRHNPSITWIGHATFLVRMDGVTFLTDPIFSERASPVQFAGPKRFQPPGVPLDALPKVDFVVLSHDHYDHTDFDSVKALAALGARFFVPLELGALVREAGGEAVELDWWQSARFGNVEVHCVPAQHFSGRSLTDQGTRLWAGFSVVGPTKHFYHAGDTGYFDGFAQIRERIGAPDLAAVPIGAYDPAEIMRFVHMNPEEAAQAAVDLGAGNAVGMHFGTFDLTDEPSHEPPGRFRRAATSLGMREDQAWVLDVGETRQW
jgi:N-acyl-phosphatidylethanolamine-hydrolysing phospholipase D